MSNVGTALAASVPLMADSTNGSSRGSDLFTVWSAKRLSWSDVAVTKDETSIALVMKDSDAERGKAMCVSGSIVEIAAVHTNVGTIYQGEIATLRSLVRFRAVRSSGKLVESSSARFCGFVTGRYDYANSGGGVSHAVEMVGMFDLPENRTAVAK